jgi:SAM-dependent methyltransferase
LGSWLKSPAGRYLLDWEQQRIDLEVADLFGFHALQVGLPQVDALRANRMPHRWVASPTPGGEFDALMDADDIAARARVSLCCEPEALPFDAQSLDLVVLPHTLELANDPHQALAEVERVLRPEGRVLIVGFNPASLWALRQHAGRLRRGTRRDAGLPLFMPRDGEFIGYRRLRDWLRLLSFEVEGGRFGCYRLPFRSQAWLDRVAWMDPWGDRWWPVFGAVYCCVAVKRVRGMRLVGLSKQARRATRAVAVAAAPRQGLTHHVEIDVDPNLQNPWVRAPGRERSLPPAQRETRLEETVDE